jgi:two-component system sensor histidine kinase PilS (NtrC family)
VSDADAYVADAKPVRAPLHVEPAWGTLYALALTRVLMTAAVLLSAMIFSAPIPLRVAGVAGEILPGLSAYLGFALAMALAALYYRRHFFGQLTLQLAVDLVMATILVVLGGGMRSEFVVFYLVPIAGASLMLPTSAAFFTASIAVIIMLSDAFLRGLREEHADPQLFQAGLYGAALFAITGLLRLLSVRLIRQEQLAHVRGLDLQNQLEINRLVISQMEQGVIVLDATTTVRANNLAARRLLGMGRNAQLTGRRLADLPALQSLAEEFQRWMDADAREVGWSNLVFTVPAPDGARAQSLVTPRPLRARFARPPSAQSGEFVVFLEDRNALEERAQQLKLAAMGRLTASIAHEIRNPLAAISNAGQLLEEDARDAMQKRLAGIVRENTARLNRLVEDVLRVARREAPLSDEFELRSFVEGWAAEFARDRGLAGGTIVVRGEERKVIKFEQSHLRQVLFNLVDNALRYCSGGPGSVELFLEAAAEVDGRARLWIIDDGAGVPPADRATMFEPFFTTHLRGTGLGLYLAREFCIANRSELAYEPLRRAGLEERYGFVVRFARDGDDEAAVPTFLDTLPAQAELLLRRDLS